MYQLQFNHEDFSFRAKAEGRGELRRSIQEFYLDALANQKPVNDVTVEITRTRADGSKVTRTKKLRETGAVKFLELYA